MPDAEPAEKAPSRNIGINPEELLVLPNTRYVEPICADRPEQEYSYVYRVPIP